MFNFHLKEKTEKKSIMDRTYGRQTIPEKSFAGPKEDKYWGWIQTIEANENFTLKEFLCVREHKVVWSIM